MKLKHLICAFIAALSFSGMSVHAQAFYVGASFGITVGSPTFLGGGQLGGSILKNLSARASIASDFSGSFVLDAEGLYAFADDGTWLGYVGGGASVTASQIFTDGSFEYTPYALVTAGAEYRFDTFGIFGELRGRFPVRYVGVAPEFRTGLNYYF